MKKIICIGIAILLFAFPLFYQFKTKAYDGSGTEQIPLELNGNTVIEKEFVPKYNDMKSIAIQFATFSNPNVKGTMEVIIEDVEKKEELYHKKIDISTLKDNQYYFFNIDNQPDSKGKKYKITVKSLGINTEDEVAIWGTISDEKKIVINNEERNIDFSVVYDCQKNEPKLLLYFFIYIFILGLINLLKEDNQHEEKIQRTKKKR